MSKDPFQILADELTLIRKDMDRLQRTSLDKDEAKKLNQIVTAAVLKMAKTAEDAPGEIQGALEADRDQMARSATQAATRGPFRVGAESYAKGFSSVFWPPVFAGEENVCPSEGRDVGEKVCRGALAFLFSFGCGLTEVEGVPMDNDGCKQV